jgi:hypothetical protein
MRNGQVKLYLVGVLRYHDDFSRLFGRREAGFCFILVPNTADNRFQTCEERPFTYTK